MENLLFLLATSIVLRQSSTRAFKNYFIGNTGCSALMFPGERNFERKLTAGGDMLYFNEFDEKEVSYGIICIELQEQFDMEEAGTILRTYINKLKGPFYILHNTGLRKDEDWNSVSSHTVTDYWQDGDGCDYKVKGYTNGQFLSILYVRNIGQLDVSRQEQFLDSFHFRAA